MSEQVKVERDGRVVVARLDNPPHGLMTPVMVSELDALCLEADVDDGIGAVVLTGAHPERFLAHYDVRELLAAAKQSPSRAVRAHRRGARLRRGNPPEAARRHLRRHERLSAPDVPATRP